ncbi:hypothetical protein KI387_015152, partial [Taxus chinensis]
YSKIGEPISCFVNIPVYVLESDFRELCFELFDLINDVLQSPVLHRFRISLVDLDSQVSFNHIIFNLSCRAVFLTFSWPYSWQSAFERDDFIVQRVNPFYLSRLQ